jgi:hypothetical protein
MPLLRVVRVYGIEHIKVPADWGRFNRGAGKMRNQQMADMGDALIAIWDGKSTGTRHMIECARKKGLGVFLIEKLMR